MHACGKLRAPMPRPPAAAESRRAPAARLTRRLGMSRLVIVVEKASDWGSFYPSDNVVPAMDTSRQPIAAGQEERTQVINLCRSYKYLGVGYYVSLLAEARGHRVIPSVRTHQRPAQALALRPRHRGPQPEAHRSSCRRRARDTTDFGLLVYFGTTNYAPLADLARQVFEIFPCPILRLEFERQKVWQIDAIKPAGLNTLTDPQEDAFARGAGVVLASKLWRKPRTRRKFRYDIAMLHDAQRGDAAVEQEGAEVLHRGRQGPAASRSTRSRATTTRAPGRVRRPVHPRDHGARQPHLPLRASRRRRKAWW